MSDYVINGRPIIPPTDFRWRERNVLDIAGDNRPIYSAMRTAELRWQFDYYQEFALLQATFAEMQSTGTATVRLPAYPDYIGYPGATGIAYGFREYSGCILGEPVMGAFFEGFPSDVALVIANIATS